MVSDKIYISDEYFDEKPANAVFKLHKDKNKNKKRSAKSDRAFKLKQIHVQAAASDGWSFELLSHRTDALDEHHFRLFCSS